MPTEFEFNVSRVHWESEHALPDELTSDEFEKMYQMSRMRGGERMFPYIEIVSEDEDTRYITRLFLGI